MVVSPLLQGYLTTPFIPDHRAIDIGWNALGIKDPYIFSWADGIVLDNYYHAPSGNVMVIKHPVVGADYYYLVRFLHLKARSALKIGTQVKCNQPVGVGGNTGTTSTGNHLHWELWVCPNSYVWSQGNLYVSRPKYAVDPRLLFYTNMKGEGFKNMSVTPSNMPYAITKESNLRYRDLPSLTAIVIGYLPPNVKIDYLGKTNVLDGYVWAKLLLNDRIVYSAINYLTVVETPKTEVITQIVEVPVQIDTTLSDEHTTVTVKTK